jgi:hypothetical protein
MRNLIAGGALLMCGLASVAVGCGGSTASDGAAASAGNAASAGSSAAGDGTGGGSAGSHADAGSAQGGSNVAATCVSGATKPPVSELITDFSDAAPDPANPGEFRFGGGDAARVQGSSSRFANPASTKGTLSIGDGALSFAATVSAPSASGPDQFPFNGVVLQIDGAACIDASAYSGVSFTLSGDLGTCNLTLAFPTADDLDSMIDPARGLCSGSCYPSQFTLSSTSTSVSFTATPVVPGMPVSAVDKAKLLGVQWALVPSGTTSCTASFTIDDVKFE